MASAMSSLADWLFDRDNPFTWRPENHEQRRSKNEENRMILSSETRPTVTFNDTVAVATIIHDNYQSVQTTDNQLRDKHTARLMTRRSPAPEIIDPQKRMSDLRLDTLLESQNEWMKEEARLYREIQNKWIQFQKEREEREEKEFQEIQNRWIQFQK